MDKIDGEWREVDANERLVMKDYGERLDADRRKRDAILQILFEEAAAGRCYTTNQFAEAFEGQAGLGGERTIRERVSALSTQGYIKYFRNAADYGLTPARTKYGYLCVEDMVLRTPAGEPDADTGEVPMRDTVVWPTHYKCPLSGAALPVENPEAWVYRTTLTIPGARMNPNTKLAKLPTSPISRVVGKLKPANCNPLQIKTCSDVASWQVGNAANLPTGANPHGCWVSTLLPVGENSPSYYVGEGPEGPSTLRRGLSLDGRHATTRCILALDLGTQTGWALRTRDRCITSGSESFRPQRFEGGGMRYLRFRGWLTELKATADGLDAVFFEEVRRHAGVDAAHAYGGFLATLTAWCEHHQIPYQGVPVGTIKKHATGQGNAGKEAVMAAVRARGHAPADHNEADALALCMGHETQEI